MLKITLETELKSVTVSVPTFNPNTELFDYIWEFRNTLLAYGFLQQYIDSSLGFFDEEMIDEAIEDLEKKKEKPVN